jgi:uncharacterized protein (TIGR00730 family)
MNICVFCGSRRGTHAAYETAATTLGTLLAHEGHTLVYGGGNVGLMGIVADAVLAGGGKVIGVIPDFLLQREVGHRNVTTLEVVDTMHTRKKRMADLSDAFIAMPGGWGTLDELAEILTWKQLELVTKPVGLLNTRQFFDPLLAQMQLMVDDGFLDSDQLALLIRESTPKTLLSALRAAIR